jgi:serine protease Do
MVISKDGYVITNNHVVQGSVAISVHLWDKRTFEAEVTGTDEASDIALLKILNPGDEQIEFVPVMFGDSSRVRIGEWVIAIGNPLGLENTLTVGVVSAKGRSKVIPRPGIYENFIQTDAAINKGNSGGPLFNLNGKVIGMNTAIWTDSAVHHGSIGLGFAIPADMIRYVIKQLKEKGTVSRGWLGVRISDVTPEVARELNLDINKSDSMKGAYIPQVFENSPAEQGGLKKGDIIIEVNGKKIESASYLQSEIAMTPIGSVAEITVLRNGEKENLRIKIGNREEAIAAVDTGMNPAFFGMKLRNLSKQEAERFGADRPCVQVIEVARDSIAQKAEIEPLDIILKIGHTPVSSVAEFRREVRKSSIEKGIPLVILDNEGLHAAELKKE